MICVLWMVCIHSVVAVEIGTSNFYRIVEEIEHKDVLGLSVDIMELYIDQLLNKPCWKKLAVVVVGKAIDVPEDGLAKTHVVHPDDIKKHNLPSWLR